MAVVQVTFVRYVIIAKWKWAVVVGIAIDSIRSICSSNTIISRCIIWQCISIGCGNIIVFDKALMLLWLLLVLLLLFVSYLFLYRPERIPVTAYTTTTTIIVPTISCNRSTQKQELLISIVDDSVFFLIYGCWIDGTVDLAVLYFLGHLTKDDTVKKGFCLAKSKKKRVIPQLEASNNTKLVVLFKHIIVQRKLFTLKEK